MNYERKSSGISIFRYLARRATMVKNKFPNACVDIRAHEVESVLKECKKLEKERDEAVALINLMTEQELSIIKGRIKRK